MKFKDMKNEDVLKDWDDALRENFGEEVMIKAQEKRKEKMCDNCILDISTNNQLHRCRANEDSCIDGKECPDYQEYCSCIFCSCGISFFDGW